MHKCPKSMCPVCIECCRLYDRVIDVSLYQYCNAIMTDASTIQQLIISAETNMVTFDVLLNRLGRSGVFAQASPRILRASYSSDIGITTNTTSDFSSACVVLALVAGRQDCQPRPNSQRQQLRLFCQQLSTTSFLHDCNDSLRDAFQCISMHRAA